VPIRYQRKTKQSKKKRNKFYLYLTFGSQIITMASRHPIPLMRVSDIGSDDRVIIPRFPDPAVVEFSAGKGLEEFVRQISANKSTRIVAAAGAGKSVRMPTELYRSMGGVLVHCVPSLLLAVSLHDYVKSLNQPDVPINLCSEVVDEYPTSGLVFTSSATFLGQVCRWRSLGSDPSVMLYMDECHESDCSTAVIRRLRHAMPGVSRYAESSATHGTGDMSSSFAQARLPSVVNEVKCSMPPPNEWRMTDGRVPWSLKKLGADIIVFSDDDDEAAMIMAKFVQSGLRAFRLTGHTSIDEFRRVMSSLNTSGQDVVTVLVVDYTFRSGFSFPTIDRVIDMSSVRFFVNEGGKTVPKYRLPYNAEVYQTKNRGGRVKGRNCDYFRMQFEPENIQVYLEGAEAMMACMWYRMLGYNPESLLDGTPTYSGKVPRNMLLAMAGRHVMTCYAFDSEWPGKRVERSVSPEVAPMVLASPVVQDVSPISVDGMRLEDYLKSPVVDVATYSGFVGNRPPSVFSLGEDAEEDGVLSEERFLNAHRKSIKLQVPVDRNKDVPPLPDIDTTFSTVRGINALRNSMQVKKTELLIGKYYRLHGFDGTIITEYFPDGIYGVISAAHHRPVGKFVVSLAPAAALEAKQRAVIDVNRATVKYRAVVSVMERVQKQSGNFGVLDADALRQWFEMSRDLLLGADATIRDCFKVLERTGIGEVTEVRPGLFADDEKQYVGAVLNILRTCVSTTSSSLNGELGSVDSGCMGEVLSHAENYTYLGGRVNMRISGKSLREKFANLVLGGKAVEVDAIMAS